jgi:drug/metabolite transporter (DMT)-like permease
MQGRIYPANPGLQPPSMSSVNRHMTGSEWSLLVFLSILWGMSFYFMGVAVRELPPFTIVLMRVVLAAAALNLLLRATGQRLPVTRETCMAFLVLGLLNNAVPFSLIIWGASHIPTSLAAILNASTPLFALVVAHLLTRDEKMTPARGAGVIVGFGGIIVMIGVDALRALGTHVVAQIAVLAGSLSYAVASSMGRRYQKLGLKPLQFASGQFTASMLLMLPVALLVDRPWELAPPGAGAWGAVIGMGLLSTALAYIIYFRVLATAGAVNILLVTFLVPVTSIILGAALLGERLHATHFLGMGLIGLGLVVIDGRALRAFRRN